MLLSELTGWPPAPPPLPPARPAPLLSQLVEAHLGAAPAAHPRFVDVSTGTRAPRQMRNPATAFQTLPPSSPWGAHCSTGAGAQRKDPLLPPCPPAGMRLRYLQWGRGGEDAVLLLHGVGEAAEVWAPLAAGLQARGYRVLAPDLRGEGPGCLCLKALSLASRTVSAHNQF